MSCDKNDQKKDASDVTKDQQKEDDDMTPNERMEWLRERGVLVETPEERKRQQVVAAMKTATELEGGSVITYVHIPADTSKPITECSAPSSKPSSSGDVLLEHLKPMFAKTSDQFVDTELLQKQGTGQVLGSSETPVDTVSDKALQQVAQQANIETFTLVHPMEANNYTSVQIYLDEVGMLKHLPMNTRAAKFAERTGFNPPPTFYGDVYMGRVQYKPRIRNVSFGVHDANDGSWMSDATSQNLRYQSEMNAMTGRSNATQAGVDGSDGNAKQEDGYGWTQTEQELEVVVPELPVSVTSKQITVKFHPQSVAITIQGDDDAIPPPIQLQLFEKVDIDGCTWTTETSDTKKLVITMEKVEEALWPRICD